MLTVSVDAAKMVVEETDTGVSIAQAINPAEVRVRTAVPIARVIHLEPDIYAATPDRAT